MFARYHKHKDTVIVNGTVQTVTYFLLSVIVIFFFILVNLDKDIEFKSTLVFMTLFMSSYLILIGLSITPKIGNRLKNPQVLLFFQHDVTPRKLLYIPVGTAISFVFSLIVSNIGLSQSDGSLLAIIGSGVVMMVIFLRTFSLLIVIGIHASFNSLIMLLTEGNLLASTPISIPTIGISLGEANKLTSEIIFQYFLVAPAEEMFKMLGMAFIFIVLTKKFDPKSNVKYLAGLFAVAVWGSYHLIQAI